jgi:hypothetical protein
MTELLELSRLEPHNRLHNQIASRLADGGLMLSCNKLVGNGWRVTMMHVPGLVRFDVRAHGDSMQAMLRPLYDGLWGAQNLYSSPWGTKANEAEVPWRATWQCGMEIEGTRLMARIDLAAAWSDSTGLAHLSSVAVVRPVSDG